MSRGFLKWFPIFPFSFSVLYPSLGSFTVLPTSKRPFVFPSEINEKYFQAPTPLSRSEDTLQPTKKRSGQVCLNTLPELTPFTGVFIKVEFLSKIRGLNNEGLRQYQYGKRSVPLQTAAIVFKDKLRKRKSKDEFK